MKKFITTISVIALVLAATSCLKEDDSAIVSPYNFFKSSVQIRAAVNGCYDPLNRIHDLRYYIAVEGTTDLAATNNSAQKDARLDINPASPGAGTHVWQWSWYGIRYCLSTLAGIRRSPLSDSEKSPFEVETRILLSYYYYILTSFFGDVPFYEDYIENDEDMARIAKLGRMSATQTRQTLIDELKLYVPTLPQVRTSDQEFNSCGAAMGWMMIAKMAAWNKDWDDVIYACEHLEAIYGDLSQYPYSDVMFRNKNTPESIFEINHEFEDGGIDYTPPSNLGISAVVMPYPKRDGESAVFDSVTIPELGSSCTCYTPLRPSSYLKTYVAPTGTGDIFKFEETYLKTPEAILPIIKGSREKGNFPKSIEYLNRVRARAEIQSYSFISEVKLRGEIRDERGRELFGEFGRKYDLVRWGIWYDQVLAYNTYNLVQQNIRPCHEYYPIPDDQCARTGRILSNPEYDKYGLSADED